MSGQIGLDTAGLALSLFNTMLLIWLGLTVLFNAERRSWGMYLAASGLLVGGAFFFSHSVILSLGAASIVQDFLFWWYAAWLPLILAPYTWCLLMQWYSGYWDDRFSRLKRRQRPWFWLSFFYTIFLLVLLLIANPVPEGVGSPYPGAAGLPPVILAFPPYLLLCIGIALDALLRPAPSGRVMGDLARRRAQPWLLMTTLVLLLVSLIAGSVIVWLVQTARPFWSISELLFTHSTTLSILDLTLTALLVLAVLLLGQAVITYEIFTGRTLPRRGFKRQWRDITLLAGGLSLLSALGLTAAVIPIYSILGVLLLTAISYALFSRMRFAESEQSIRQLRPFTNSQRLLDRILTPSQNTPLELEFADAFQAVCEDILGARRALLLPLGAMAGLAIPILRHPYQDTFDPPAYTHLLDKLSSPQMIGLPLDPRQHHGFIWVAPLWSARGLIGLLFFSEKDDGGFYSLEEIEIARASGERLADLLASAEISRRLITLQRQRLIESAVLDQRARHVLHDDILPRLHTALLSLGDRSSRGAKDDADLLDLLSTTHRQISDLLRDLPRPVSPELERLGLVGALHRVIESELPGSFDRVDWQIDPHAESKMRALPPVAAEVLFFAAREGVRNAARHARPAVGDHSLHLKICAAWDHGLELQIEDNGVGILSIRTAPGHGGQGLALHSTMMAVINGSLMLDSAPGRFTRLRLYLPETALSLWDSHPPPS